MIGERKKLGVLFCGVVSVSLVLLYLLSAPPLQLRILPADLPPLAMHASRELPSEFNPREQHEAARWAAKVLRPLNEMPYTGNETARNDATEVEIEKIKALTEPFVGQSVSWIVPCYVAEKEVSFRGTFKQSGLWAHKNQKEDIDKLALKICVGKPPSSEYLDEWRLSVFRVPDDISREAAGKLDGRATIKGTIEEIRVEKYFVYRYLLCIYLKDVMLE
jgi:hypothetical protein